MSVDCRTCLVNAELIRLQMQNSIQTKYNVFELDGKPKHNIGNFRFALLYSGLGLIVGCTVLDEDLRTQAMASTVINLLCLGWEICEVWRACLAPRHGMGWEARQRALSQWKPSTSLAPAGTSIGIRSENSVNSASRMLV